MLAHKEHWLTNCIMSSVEHINLLISLFWFLELTSGNLYSIIEFCFENRVFTMHTTGSCYWGAWLIDSYMHAEISSSWWGFLDMSVLNLSHCPAGLHICPLQLACCGVLWFGITQGLFLCKPRQSVQSPILATSELSQLSTCKFGELYRIHILDGCSAACDKVVIASQQHN